MIKLIIVNDTQLSTVDASRNIVNFVEEAQTVEQSISNREKLFNFWMPFRNIAKKAVAYKGVSHTRNWKESHLTTFAKSAL